MDFDATARQLLEGIPSFEGKPFYALAAGGPASHKSLLSALMARQGVKGVFTISEETLAPFFPDDKSAFPHHEKTDANIRDYYTLVSHIVKEAKKRNISVIFEDHGDYPQVYRQHLKELGPGYSSFLLATTISPSDYDAKVSYIVEHDGGLDFKEWGKAYHRRFAESFNNLPEIFDKGILLETRPGYISPDHESHAHGVLRFNNTRAKPAMEVLDEQRYQTFRSWEGQEISPEFRSFFRAADTAMESGYPAERASGSVGGSRTHRKREAQEETFLDKFLSSAKGKRGADWIDI